MESTVNEFISRFQTPETMKLFSESLCYWFAHILHHRFPNSWIVYDPHTVHFAASIGGRLYDINGRIKNPEDYYIWENYDLEDRESLAETLVFLR